jgi:hypothetical protein
MIQGSALLIASSARALARRAPAARADRKRNRGNGGTAAGQIRALRDAATQLGRQLQKQWSSRADVLGDPRGFEHPSAAQVASISGRQATPLGLAVAYTGADGSTRQSPWLQGANPS